MFIKPNISKLKNDGNIYNLIKASRYPFSKSIRNQADFALAQVLDEIKEIGNAAPKPLVEHLINALGKKRTHGKALAIFLKLIEGRRIYFSKKILKKFLKHKNWRIREGVEYILESEEFLEPVEEMETSKMKTSQKAKKGTKNSQFSDVKYKEKEVTNGNTYIVYKASNKVRAMEFLRATDVKEEQKYLIVETPEGNLGKDMIMIFNEATQELIEYGERNPLPELSKSKTNCARCGYPVLPMDNEEQSTKKSSPFEMLLKGLQKESVEPFVPLDDMKLQGHGFFCPTCQTCWCSFCVSETKLRCDICGGTLTIFKS
ncbi:MAG: hypothetical protein A2057_09240 [Ignavibacteria bacterium GWA2_35_9]|nr:MAG: hypothetical protein A2057_09240 [Ignavibacteria bacterium GWA2_35_9]OGU47261.1 MAG: hypothetical protein A2000_05935 [Ignavibacteria bacterium GWB2_36_8]OGU49237.1 MAG: hypothetical protein A2080_15270 [Ignavibacteria bacterium GWC2_36_12]